MQVVRASIGYKSLHGAKEQLKNKINASQGEIDGQGAVMNCPALIRKLVFGFYERAKASHNCIIRAIYIHVAPTSGGNPKIEHTGTSCYQPGWPDSQMNVC